MVQKRLSHSSDTTAEPSPASTTYHQNEDIIKAFFLMLVRIYT